MSTAMQPQALATRTSDRRRPEDVEVGQVPVPLVDVEAVADEELVGDGEADVADRQVVDEAAVGAVEERDRRERARSAERNVRTR